MQIQNAYHRIFLPPSTPFPAILAVLQVLLFAKSGIHPQIKYVISISATLAITDLFTTSYSVHQLVDHQVVNFSIRHQKHYFGGNTQDFNKFY